MMLQHLLYRPLIFIIDVHKTWGQLTSSNIQTLLISIMTKYRQLIHRTITESLFTPQDYRLFHYSQKIIQVLIAQSILQWELKLILFITTNNMNIHCEQNCLQEYNNIKFRKIQARYLVFAIQQQHIVLEKVGDKNQGWNDFVNGLPQHQNRYAVYDAQFTKYDGMAVNKLIFVSWNPDDAPLKMRVLYATAKDNFKRSLQMNSKDFTLNCVGDVTEEDVIKELSK